MGILKRIVNHQRPKRIPVLHQPNVRCAILATVQFNPISHISVACSFARMPLRTITENGPQYNESYGENDKNDTGGQEETVLSTASSRSSPSWQGDVCSWTVFDAEDRGIGRLAMITRGRSPIVRRRMNLKVVWWRWRLFREIGRILWGLYVYERMRWRCCD